MAQIRNVSGEARYVPSIDRVVDVDETVDIPDELAAGFAAQAAIWDTGTPTSPQPAAPVPAAPAPAASVPAAATSVPAAADAPTPAGQPAAKEG